MAQLVSVRSNTDFGVHYEKGILIPQTEIIILVQEPKYIEKGDVIKRGTEALNHLIGQLQSAQRVAAHYDQMAGSMNEIIKSVGKPPEGNTNV